jgi:hypothetical protein
MATKLEASKDVSADSLYDFACACSRSVAAVHKDSKLAPAEQARLAEQYGTRAVRLCSLAVAKGYKGFSAVNNIMQDPDLNPIRSRPDFRKLLEDLKKKAPEKSRG